MKTKDTEQRPQGPERRGPVLRGSPSGNPDVVAPLTDRILDSLSEQVVYQDAGHRIVRANRAAAESVGLAPEELVGRYCYEALRGAGQPHQGCPLEKARQTGRPETAEITGADGKVWLVRGDPVRDAAGNLVGLIETSREITGEKRDEEALRESEARFQTAFHANPVAMTIASLTEGRCVEVNDSFLEMTEYSREQVIGHTSAELDMYACPEERARTARVFPEEGRIHNREVTARTRTGKLLTVLSSSESLVFKGQEHIMSIVIDITERRRAEEALRNSEDRYRQLIAASPDGVAMLDSHGRTTFASRRLLELFGYGDEREIIGGSPPEWVAPEDRERAGANIGAILKGGVTGPSRYCMLRKDGSSYWGEVNSSIIRDPKGEPAGVIAVIRDVSERRRMEDRLRESEEKYRNLAESISDVFFAMDQDLRYTYWNRASERLTGVAAEDALGKHILDLFPDNERTKRAVEFYQAALRTRQPRSFVNETRLHGRDFAFEISAYPAGDGLSVFVKDITDRKRAEDDLKRSREELAALASHLQTVREAERTGIAREIHDELGQYLTALQIDLSWLSKRLREGDRAGTDKARRMAQLLDQTMQAVQRISSSLRPGILDDLGLVAAVEWLAADFEERTGARCRLKLPGESVTLDRDASTTVFRILQETLTNIARHSGATEVNIGLTEQSGRLLLVVEDNGKGITEEEILSPKSLGLIGIRERVSSLRGDLAITGLPDKGTTVKVTIPLGRRNDAL